MAGLRLLDLVDFRHVRAARRRLRWTFGEDGDRGRIARTARLPHRRSHSQQRHPREVGRSTGVSALEGRSLPLRPPAADPRASKVLGAQDELSFFYNVYNAKKDPASGKPSLDVSYSIEKKEGGT